LNSDFVDGRVKIHPPGFSLLEVFTRFETIANVVEHKFAGNHAEDSEAFNAIDQFCRREDVRTDKLRALHHWVAVGMGLPYDEEMAREELKHIDFSQHMRSKWQKRMDDDD
jgi:hypothetical protein